MVLVALLCVGWLPLVNLGGGILHGRIGTDLASLRAEAFKLDAVLGVFNAVASRVGYSTAPRQAVVGRDGWLFLGDEYAYSVSAMRGRVIPSAESMAIYRERLAYLDATAVSHGARGAVFFVAPNKEDIYPEHYPAWAWTPDKAFSSMLRASPEAGLHLLHDAIAQEKGQHAAPLYYRTDSHWNDLGAWIAYRHIMQSLNAAGHSLAALSDQDVSVSLPVAQAGGDIASFLFANRYLQESVPTVSIRNDTMIQVAREGAEAHYSGPNRPISSHDAAKRVSAASALNPVRVLWLRDSFGTALSGYFARTFSDVIQVHPGKVLHDNKRYAALLETYRPDLVIVTLVGRSYLENVYFATELAKSF